ncbi:MAG: site-specific integrase [Solobacterium sp.]|nr:site-specific integrase [Solobacterium sp.]
MASIKKNGNGTYTVRVCSGRDYEGKQIFHNTTFTPTKKTPKAIEKEVKTFAEEYERRIKDEGVLSGEKITFKTMMDRWKEEWACDHLTQSQIEQYEITLIRHVLPTIGHLPMCSITPLQVQNLVHTWKKKYAPKTVRRHVTAMNSVFKMAFRLNVIKENPCTRIELPKLKPDEGIHCFTLEQSKQFLEFLSEPYRVKFKGHTRTLNGKQYEVPDYYETYTVPYQFQVYFNLAIIGGFRRGELLALTWNDINFRDNTISITKAVTDTRTYGTIVKTPKTQSGVRCLCMPQHCMDMLNVWKLQQEELSHSPLWEGKTGTEFNQNNVFIQDNGKRMDTKTPSHKFKQILKRYNDSVENEEDKLPVIRLHDLRHTSATLLIAEGCDISTVSHRLGHSKASVTLDVYTHHLEAKDAEASNTLSNLFSFEKTPQNASQTISDAELLSVLNSLTPDQLHRLKLSFEQGNNVQQKCNNSQNVAQKKSEKSLYLLENSVNLGVRDEGVASSNLVIPTIKQPSE